MNWSDPFCEIKCGNTLDILSAMEAESVQCVVTSPPYWGLRKYAGEQELVWGDNHCEHEWGNLIKGKEYGRHDTNDPRSTNFGAWSNWDGDTGNDARHRCLKCGAWRGAYGLEPTVEMYVDHTVQFLRAIWRVLRKDGVVFWNIGDSYAGGKGQSGSRGAEYQGISHELGESLNTDYQTLGGALQTRPTDDTRALRECNIKPKDMCLIPFRVAIAAQQDGWWVRSVIIWSKPNPMPESVKDRPTESHEYILMLTRSKDYYWDIEAVREPAQDWGTRDRYQP